MTHSTYKRLTATMMTGLIASVAFASSAAAIDRDIGASATFVKALVLTKADMEFGSIEYSEGAGANDVKLAAVDGALTCTNTTEYTCPAAATPGEIGIAGGLGHAVNIFCTNESALSNDTEALDMNNIELGHSSVAYGCAGLSQVATTHTIAGNVEQDTFSIGGKIEIPSTGVGQGGVFTTAASGGSAITVRVVYQ